MKIGLFTDFYLPHQGGVETAVLSHAQALRGRGHEVTVVCAKYKGHPQDEPGTLRLSGINPRHPHLHPIVKISVKNKAAVDAQTFDIVHIHTDGAIGHLGAWYARKRNVPLIQTIHTNDMGWARDNYARPMKYLLSGSVRLQSGWQAARLGVRRSRRLAKRADYLYNHWLLKKIFASSRFAKTIIVPSAHFMEELREFHPSGNYAVVPNGVDVGAFEPQFEDAAKPVRILWIGRASAEKRPLAFLEAIRLLEQRKTPSIHVDMIGTGPEFNIMRKFVRQNNLACVTLRGGVPYDTVKSFWSKADVFALTSHHLDNQPMVLVEAAASGVPVVLSDKRLLNQIAPGGYFLAPSPTALSIAEALDKSLHKKNPQTAAPIIEFAKATYSLEVLAKNLEKIYKM